MKDHGLTSARLMLTPIIAGLAAVGGVFLTSLLANGVAGAVSGTGSAAGVPDIGTIYNVSVKPFGLLLAAVLGLSPNMLIGALQDQAGGVKGIGLAGALSVVEARGYQPHNVAGTSAGAITASLVAAGYTAAEIKQIIFDLNFKDFMDQDFLGRLPLLGAAWH